MLRKVFFVVALLSLSLLADNNLVTTLKVTPRGEGSRFTLERDGWVRLEGKLAEQVTFSGKKKSQTVATSNGIAVCWLKAGEYTVNARVDSARRIGNNMFFQMCGKFGTDEKLYVPVNAKATGRAGMFIYNWNYLRKEILDSYPTILLNAPWTTEVDRWKAEGRRVLKYSGVYPTGDECKSHWEKDTLPGYDGIVTDEFVIPTGRKNASDAALGYNNPGNGFKTEIYKAMKAWHKAHPACTFWGWLGLPWDANSEDAKPLVKTLQDMNSILLWESYASTRNWEHELELRYKSRLAGYAMATGNDCTCLVVAPGTFEYNDKNAYVDVKVFLEMQVHLVATSPYMKHLGGLSLWTSYYMDPEILRWYSLLVKHYAVEGNTDLLYPTYGFSIEPKLLKEADWENLNNWKLFGKATLVGIKESGLPMSAYYPRSQTNMLQLNPAEDGTFAGASQVISGLVPGKMYSVSTLVVDPKHDKSEVWYGVEIALDQADVVETTLRQVHDFQGISKSTCNHIKVVFRATSNQVTLTLRRSEKSPAVPLLLDSVSVMPYFE